MKSRATEFWSLSWFACSACGWEQRVTVNNQSVNEEANEEGPNDAR